MYSVASLLERPIAIEEPLTPDCSIESCPDAGACNACSQVACLDHGDTSAVICEVDGFTCGQCHQDCSSIRCALEHADPDA